MFPILMGSENPNGITLEVLLEELQAEITGKINKIIDKDSPQAKFVVENNRQILEHLGAALALQRASNRILDAIGPNQGPTGKARI